MLMSVLALATTLQAVPLDIQALNVPTVQQTVRLGAEQERAADVLRIPVPSELKGARRVAVTKPTAPCQKMALQHVAKLGGATPEALSNMPMAYAERAVSRTVDGCAIAVRVAVSGPAR
ncbi:hypothetical protein CA606_13655 [Caulobacter vibrioides]|uniref:Uncharacterized protein n=1 Tax=Caulobacter vibrioides TaxID=155892 RepID=A0A290MY34_CAUVI|nr:hypothetical protein [Caulobacter vibrioides]ATC33290.2 hypothetical protein CA606_13655 [Caulobacter vibrioides]